MAKRLFLGPRPIWRHFCNRSSQDVISSTWQEESDLQVHRELLVRYQLQASGGNQNVFVVQPFLRNSAEFVGEGQQEFQLKLTESLALVDTLGWTVTDSEVFGLSGYGKAMFFGSGQVDALNEKLKNQPQTTAVFVSNYR